MRRPLAAAFLPALLPVPRHARRLRLIAHGEGEPGPASAPRPAATRGEGR